MGAILNNWYFLYETEIEDDASLTEWCWQDVEYDWWRWSGIGIKLEIEIEILNSSMKWKKKNSFLGWHDCTWHMDQNINGSHNNRSQKGHTNKYQSVPPRIQNVKWGSLALVWFMHEWLIYWRATPMLHRNLYAQTWSTMVLEVEEDATF